MSDDQSIGVIYVEDDDDVRIGGVQALELAGFSVSGFASVETASASVRADMPFVVVCDVRLRGKSGLDWLSDLRGLDQDLPVILITGHGDISMAVQAMRNGAYDFIEKPCSSEQLISVVRRAAEKRRLTLEVRAPGSSPPGGPSRNRGKACSAGRRKSRKCADWCPRWLRRTC